MVLVDTLVIAKAPAKLLVAGKGNGMATYFEARICRASGSNNQKKLGLRRNNRIAGDALSIDDGGVALPIPRSFLATAVLCISSVT